jgi:hypothetical protein
MKITNVIIVSKQGMLHTPIVCNCSTRAGLIYADEARKLGVELNEEDVQNMGFDDMVISKIMQEVDNTLENMGCEILWFECDVLKRLK